ncbi:MAG: TIGR00153 family protein [Thermoplasmatota archaeon]
MGAKYRRSSLEETFFESPFDGLRKHSLIIKKAIKELKVGVHDYIDGDFEKAEEHFDKVSKLEHKADKVKIHIRENLPSFIFMPITRDDFMSLLRESDSILDHAEDVGVLLPMREEPVPDFISDELKEFLAKVFETVEDLEKLMDTFSELLESSFGKKSKEEARLFQEKISHNEWEADNIEKKIAKKLFNYDEKPLEAVHLLKVIDRMDSIADHSENVADMIDAFLESK